MVKNRNTLVASVALVLWLAIGVAFGGVGYSPPLAVNGPHFYYLSETGSDRNNGLTPDKPWLTFTFASAHMVGNSTLILACGDYPTNGASGSLNQFHNIASANLGDRGWLTVMGDPACPNYPSITGTAGGGIPISPTTQSNFTQYRHLQLVCTYQSNCNCAASVFPAHHLAFVDLLIGPCHGGGIAMSGGNDYIYIAHVIAHDTSDTSTFQGSGISVGFMVASDDLPGFHNIIKDVISYNNITTFAGSHTDGNGIIIDDSYGDQKSQPEYQHATLIDGAIVFNNGARGVEVFDSSYVVVRHVASYNNGQDSQLVGASYGVGDAVYPSINTERAHDNQFYDIAAKEKVATVPAFRLGGVHNFMQSSVGMNIDGTVPKIQGSNNVLGSRMIYADPQFVDPDNPGTTWASIKAAFTLKAGSPGLGTGYDWGYNGTPAFWDSVHSTWTENVPMGSANMGQ